MRKMMKFFTLLLCFLLFLCLSGCSKVSGPFAKAEPKTDRYGVFYSWKDDANPNQKNIYKEPANKEGGIVGEVKEHEVFKILGEKDFFFEIETKDKVKGWLPKSHTAEVFYEADFKKEKDDKKAADNKKPAEAKDRAKPDAVVLYEMSGAEDMGMNPKTWYEASPKIDMELRELPYELSKVVAHAKAKHRYLITSVADTRILAYSPRMVFGNGAKAEELYTLGYKAAAFFDNNQVTDFLFDDYLSNYNYENKGSEAKARSYWICLKTEDGEGWVQPYNAPAQADNWYKHKKRHVIHKFMDFILVPKGNHIEYKDPGIKVFEKPDINSKAVKGPFSRRVMVLEEKDGWKKIMSCRDGLKGWVGSANARPAKDRFGLTVANVDSEAEPDRPEEPVREMKGTVTGTDVRIRTGPGTYYSIAGYYDKGEELAVLREDHDWYEVKRSDGTTGWVSGAFLLLQFVDGKK